MSTIRHTETLFYHDRPQVFEARDNYGCYYVAVMVESDDGRHHYLVAGVAPDRLRQFRAGAVDLRSLLTERTNAEWYLATADEGLDQPLALVVQNTSLVESTLLPDAGFLLHEATGEVPTIHEARERENLLLNRRAGLPGVAEEHGIGV